MMAHRRGESKRGGGAQYASDSSRRCDSGDGAQYASGSPRRGSADAAMSRGRINVTGVNIDPIGLDAAARAVAILAKRAAGGDATAAAQPLPAARHSAAKPPPSPQAAPAARSAYVCTPNAEIMMEARKDRQLMEILNAADLVVADGAGVVLAARILGYGRIERAPGFDLTRKLFSDPDAYPLSYYLLGGKPGVAEAAAGNIRGSYPGARIAGCRNGYFGESEEAGVIAAINGSGADVLLVALGAPKQEKWIYRNRDRLRIPVCIGVGGSLDIYAGTAALAPDLFRKSGLEWLYRLAKEPWRAKRMCRLPLYVLYSLLCRLRDGPMREPGHEPEREPGREPRHWTGPEP
jgi:N-acetylglucosaminyldiphosphoundecaprenol N-acetyl-beta-D-mannosaminyltransferase